MTTIPLDLAWLIVASFILMPAMAYLASYEANRHATRHHRKWMKEREKTLRLAEQQLAEQQLAADQRFDEHEQAVRDLEMKLGRKAHDLAAQTQVVLRQANSRDTVPTMQEL